MKRNDQCGNLPVSVCPLNLKTGWGESSVYAKMSWSLLPVNIRPCGYLSSGSMTQTHETKFSCPVIQCPSRNPRSPLEQKRTVLYLLGESQSFSFKKTRSRPRLYRVFKIDMSLFLVLADEHFELQSIIY